MPIIPTYRKSCSSGYKCAKCGEDHATKLCPKEKDEKPRCANCNGDYTANYR
jgi:DNA-directed RNA polymerase subunit RPC12/RpoP